jgi:hypothetical protein
MYIPIGLFLFTLFFYLRTLCATFNINDSGETIMDCNNLAIAHAPGYPLHTLLGRIFCLLPLGQPMFRLTFASAVMGALATVMVYLVLRKILKNIPTSGQSRFLVEIPALFAALCFAFSYQQWFQSCGAKGSIYMLNILLSITLVFLLLKMREEGGFVKGFFLSVFLFGLGLANHWPNQVVMAPSFFILLLAAQNRVPGEAFLKNLLRPFDQWANLRKAAGSLSAASLVRSLAFLLLAITPESGTHAPGPR